MSADVFATLRELAEAGEFSGVIELFGPTESALLTRLLSEHRQYQEDAATLRAAVREWIEAESAVSHWGEPTQTAPPFDAKAFRIAEKREAMAVARLRTLAPPTPNGATNG